MDKATSEGYGANGQNAPRESNPYLHKARAWDEGWVRREREVLIHRLEKEEAQRIPVFEDFVLAMEIAGPSRESPGAVESSGGPETIR